MITYICGSMVDRSMLPEEFLKDVDVLMTEGDEILLGDTENSDLDRCVYEQCRLRQYENVSSMKSLKQNRFKPQSLAKLRLPSAIKMIRKCDRMTAVWDGESQEALINILLILALHKKCRFYYLPAGKCLEISSTDEIAPFVHSREGWNSKDISEVLEVCGFGEEMKGFTASVMTLRESHIAEIISRAPLSLGKKLEIYKKLLMKNNLNYEVFSRASELIRENAEFDLVKQEILDTIGSHGAYIEECISRIEDAGRGLTGNSIYYLFDEWYDTDVFIEKSCPAGMFTSVEKAMEYIRLEEELEREDVEEDDDMGEGWYRLEAWEKSDDGQDLKHTYNYYIYRDGVCWFERMREERQENGLVYYMNDHDGLFTGSLDQSLMTPFRAGDIVSIDCRPFGPPFHAVIVEGKDQNACCFPTILFNLPYTDRWVIAALKHKMFYKDAEDGHYCPLLSPLYRLRTVRDDELTEKDDILVKVREWINGDEEKGSAFWCAFPDGSKAGVSADEVMEFLNGMILGKMEYMKGMILGKKEKSE